MLKRCLSDNGVVLIPAFSIGRTQELLYEIEEILYRIEKKAKANANGAGAEGAGSTHSSIEAVLNRVDVTVDSLLAATFTEHYESLKQCWGKEANRKLPAIVIAASMCSGGRIVNYLKRFIELETTDVLFVGYQAHADQHDLLRFVRQMRHKPRLIKIVHGDDHAKMALREALLALVPGCVIEIPTLNDN